MWVVVWVILDEMWVGHSRLDVGGCAGHSRRDVGGCVGHSR